MTQSNDKSKLNKGYYTKLLEYPGGLFLKKLLTSMILTSLAFGSITASVYAASTVVEQYIGSPGNGMYGFPTKQYIKTYSQLSTASKVVGTILRNGAIPSGLALY
jgi:hypothetical protein